MCVFSVTFRRRSDPGGEVELTVQGGFVHLDLKPRPTTGAADQIKTRLPGGTPLKKHLLSTSAIALGVAMASPAAAQQWDVTVGGFYLGYVGASDLSGSGVAGTNRDGVDTFTDGEIHFMPSITLDNGLTIGAHIELETKNTSNQIDEQYLTIEGDMLGKIIIGNENSAGYLSMTGAPGVTGLLINSPYADAYIPRTGVDDFRQAGISSFTEVAGNNDVQRITYFTPSFNGLTVGVSYAAVATRAVNVGGFNNYAPDRDLDVSDIFDIGVNYTQSFGGVDLTLAGRWGTGDSPDSGVDDPTTWGIGGRLGANGFLVGASYTENDNGVSGGAGDQKGWSLGVTYDIAGPWSVEALTYQGEVDNGSGVSDSDYEAYRVGAARDLGPGVKWEIFYIHSDTKNGTNGNKIEGDMIGTGLSLSF